MQPIEWIVIVVFLALLCTAIFLVTQFVWCTDQACQLFNEAAVETGGTTGTPEYTVAVLNGMGTNGNWPLPYIGAAILTPLSIWFLRFPVVVLNFAVMWFVSFVVIYFIFSFYIHHYVQEVSAYVARTIRNAPAALPVSPIVPPVSPVAPAALAVEPPAESPELPEIPVEVPITPVT